MKKTILSVCLASILALGIIVPISVAAATSNLGVFVSDDGIAERMELIKNYEIKSVSDEEIQITYNMSRCVSDGFADIYKDAKGNDYIYKNGKITGFYSNEITVPLSKCTPIGEELAKKFAFNVLSKFTDNATEYTIRDFEEKESYGQYYITLARKIGNIFTEEYAIVSLMYDGEVKSVAIYNEGKYDNVSSDIVNGVTDDLLKEYALSEMRVIYPDKGTRFNIRDYCLEHDTNGYYIAIYGNIDNVLECVRYDLES